MSVCDAPDAANPNMEQTEVAFQARGSNRAQTADQELVQILRQMLDLDESITAWAVTRRMQTVRHVSSLTRDPWRKERIEQAQSRQLNIRTARRLSTGIVRGSPSGVQRLPDMRVIRSFMEVARSGSMGGAARALQIPEATITQRVKQVEDWAEAQLLLRHGRGVTLTAAGSQFLARAESALQTLMSSLDKASEPRRNSNKLTLAFPSGVGPLLAPTVLTQFHMRQPEVMIEVREGTGADVEEWFVSRQVDIAMLEDPPSIAGVDMELILVQSLGLLASPQLALQGDPQQVALRDLCGQPLILLDQRHFVTRRITNASQQYGFSLTHVMETNSIPLAKVMTRQGFGRTVLPYLAALEEITQGRLLFYPILRPQLATRYVLASRSQPHYHAEFASIIRHHITAMVSHDRPRAEILSVRPAKA